MRIKDDFENLFFFVRNLGSGLNTATDIVKFIIFLVFLIMVIASAIWLLGALDTFKALKDKLGHLF